MTNLKDATHIDARGRALEGEGSAPVLNGLISATEFGVLFAQALCQKCSQLRLRLLICRVATIFPVATLAIAELLTPFLIWRMATLYLAELLITSSLVESRLNGAL